MLQVCGYGDRSAHQAETHRHTAYSDCWQGPECVCVFKKSSILKTKKKLSRFKLLSNELMGKFESDRVSMPKAS